MNISKDTISSEGQAFTIRGSSISETNPNFNIVEEVSETNWQKTPQDVIDSLPKYSIRKDGAYTTPDAICQICFRHYNIGENIICLPCKHNFHEYCIENWLRWIRSACPVDRKSILNNFSCGTPDRVLENLLPVEESKSIVSKDEIFSDVLENEQDADGNEQVADSFSLEMEDFDEYSSNISIHVPDHEKKDEDMSCAPFRSYNFPFSFINMSSSLYTKANKSIQNWGKDHSSNKNLKKLSSTVINSANQIFIPPSVLREQILKGKNAFSSDRKESTTGNLLLSHKYEFMTEKVSHRKVSMTENELYGKVSTTKNASHRKRSTIGNTLLINRQEFTIRNKPPRKESTTTVNVPQRKEFTTNNSKKSKKKSRRQRS